MKLRTFKDSELVLRRVFENTPNPADGKFQANWEGPYTVFRVGTAGSYVLSKPDGTVVPRSYALSKPDGTAVPKIRNAMHLKKYYSSVFFEDIIINKRLSITHFLLKPIIASSKKVQI